jgi:hypothetical protein
MLAAVSLIPKVTRVALENAARLLEWYWLLNVLWLILKKMIMAPNGGGMPNDVIISFVLKTVSNNIETFFYAEFTLFLNLRSLLN